MAALAGAGGCRRSPEPGALFAEAEALRAKQEKVASEQAIAKYRIAMAAWTESGHKRDAARAGLRIGATFGQLGLLHEAEQGYVDALPLARGSADRLLESEVLSGLGRAQALLADREELFRRARESCQAALEVARQSGGTHEEAEALCCLGDVAYYAQRPEQALEFYGRAERLWERVGDQRGQAEALLLRGPVYSDLGKLDRAQACYERARALWTSPGDMREQAIALILEARLQARRGDYQQALNEFERALALLQPMGDAVWEGSTLTGIAAVYRDMGEGGSSLRYWERALQLFQAAGMKNVAVDVLMSLGETHLALGHDTQALRQFEQARDLAEELEIQRWKAHALRYMAVIHLFRHLPNRAREYLESSLEVQRSFEDERLKARTFADFGDAHALLGQPKEAIRDFDRALALSRVAGDRVATARAFFGLARSSIGLDDLNAARRYVEDTLAVTESLRTEVDNRDLRASYAASVYRYNEFHMDVLMRLHEAHPARGLAAAAFAASERARARSLLDSLTEAGVDLRQGLDPDLLKRELMAKRAFDDWAERQRRQSHAPGAIAGAAALADEYRDLEHHYNQVQAEIRSRSPRYAALVQPQPLGLEQVQKQVLDAETLLLEYALGEERSYLWVVSNGDQASYVLAPRAEIEQSGPARLRAHDHPAERGLGPAGSPSTNRAGRHRVLAGGGAPERDAPGAGREEDGRQEDPGGRRRGAAVLAVRGAARAGAAGMGRCPWWSSTRSSACRRHPSWPCSGGRPRAGAPPGKAVAVLADPVFEPDDPRLRPAVRQVLARLRCREG